MTTACSLGGRTDFELSCVWMRRAMRAAICWWLEPVLCWRCGPPWASNILAVRILPSDYSARHRRWPALVALLVILNATAFLCHQYDLTEHAPGHTCVTCVAGHMLDHSLRSQIYFHPVIPFVAPSAVGVTRVSVTRNAQAFRARAPPVSFQI